MLNKFSRILAFIFGLAFIGASLHGAFLIMYKLRLTYPWRINMTLDDYPLYFPLALPVFAVWILALAVALVSSRSLSGAWLWPFSGEPIRKLRGKRPLLFLAFIVLCLVPLKNRGLDDVFIMSVQLIALILLFYGTRGLADKSFAVLQKTWRGISRLKSGYLVAFLFLAGSIIPALVNICVMDSLPHVVDEIDYLFQSKIFAGFRLSADVPPHGEFFHAKFLIQNGYGWHSQYPPGWPALLAAGTLASVPWLVNPLLGGLLAITIYLVAKVLADERTARIAGLLALLSPYLWFMNAGMMSHTSCCLFLALFLAAAIKARKDNSPWPALIAGACLGMAAIIRPYTALIYCIPLAILFVKDIIQKSESSISRPLMIVIGVSPFIALFMYYNYMTNGHPLLLGYSAIYGELHDIGFGQRLDVNPYTPMEGIRVSFYWLNALSRILFLWPAPALLPAIALFTLHRPGREDWLLLSIFIALLLGYFFYYFSGDIYTPRFLFEAAPALLILTARGLSSMWDSQDMFMQKTEKPGFSPRSYLAHLALISVIIALLFNFPYETGSYKRYEDISSGIKEMVRREKLDHAIVFLDPLIYQQGLSFMNPLRLERGNIFARDMKEKNSVLIEAYPSHKPYRATWSVSEARFFLEPLDLNSRE